MKNSVCSYGRTITHMAIALLAFLSTAVRADQFGDFTFNSYPNGVTIVKYTGPGGAVSIPDTINGLPVVSIDTYAFQSGTITSLTIPAHVTWFPFLTSYCSALIRIDVDTNNPALSSLDGVLFDKTGQRLFLYPQAKPGPYSIPSSVTNIEDFTFYSCTNLTEVRIPDSVRAIGRAFNGCENLKHVLIGTNVTHITGWCFNDCANLAGVYFNGDAPEAGPDMLLSPKVISYYRPGTKGWSTTFAGHPTAPWPKVSVQAQGHQMNVSWTNGFGVLERSTNLISGPWIQLTNVHTPYNYSTYGGSTYFRLKLFDLQ